MLIVIGLRDMKIKNGVVEIKILNLYSGIGGNRKLWTPKGDEHEVTAVENNKEIAKIYQDFFPKDKVIVTDAHKYLLDHYKEFDFIWSSPPCPSHSRIRYVGVKSNSYEAVMPDMNLYSEILFLKHFAIGRWVVENVIPYYEPLIKGQESGRHLFWSNFNISNIKPKSSSHSGGILDMEKHKGFDISKYKLPHFKGRRRDQILRNCVEPELGLHVFNCAFKEQQKVLI